MADAAMREKKRTGAASYVVAVILILGVIAVAFYQEQLGYMVRLRTWDKEGPARAVIAFLDAGKSGDKARTNSYLASSEMKPVEKNGKLVGYVVQSIVGTINYRFSELAGDSPKATKSEFVLIDTGSANVTVPDRGGQNVKYRLVMDGGQWKIREIIGGRPLN
jgi:hypothetical protein